MGFDVMWFEAAGTGVTADGRKMYAYCPPWSAAAAGGTSVCLSHSTNTLPRGFPLSVN
jgi:hypothetical protein